MEGPHDDRWEAIDSLFSAALDLPEEERRAFLDAEATDPEVRAGVERLLRAEAESRGLLDGRAAVQRALVDALMDDLASGEAPPTPPGPDRVGQRIGPYELTELVGHGGMATVYFARRVEGGFDQRVAVKLIRTDANSSELIRRFEGERAILSGLRHANIARLLDGGSTEAGVPYLVMDPVDGIPITDHVRRERADVESRLWLFLEVAAALSYAHRNLVVHRDLKPSNILVDDDGHPMLLDFGIAKLLAEGEGDAGVTQTRARWMTPGYAAPEQIRSEAVTTGTDVYQLGVLLYELLAERRPFDVEGRSTYEIEKTICEEDPPQPSVVAPPAIRTELTGDLDAIVLKAMRKEPDERYVSVEAMAADIRRHLTAEPVEALKGGRGYRARKFVRRHRGGVLAAAVVLLLLAAWAVTATVQGTRLAAERDRAEAESEKATQVTAFLTSLLQAENPREAQGSEPTVREVLERGVERIGTELADQPDVQASLYLATGDVYEALGDFAAADSLLTRAVELRTDFHGGGPHEELAEAEVMLGRLRMEQARFAEAEPLMASALTQRRALHPEGSEAIADDMVELGDAYRLVRRPDDALALYHEALAMYQVLDQPPKASIAITRNNIALVHHEAGRLAEALPLYERAVVELLDTLGPRHPYTLILQHNLAGFNRSLGRFALADSIFEDVVAMELEVNGEGPDAAAALANLGITKRRRGLYDEAADALTRAIEIQERTLDPTHPSLTLRMRNLAHVRIAQGRWDEAEALIRDFGRRQVDRSGPTGETSAIQDLGVVAREAGRTDEALERFEDALARRLEQFEPPHPAISELLVDIGRTLAEAGDLPGAMARFDEALAMTRERRGAGTDVADLLTRLADVAIDAGLLDEAERHLSEAEAELEGLPPGTSFRARHGFVAVRLDLARGDTTRARERLDTVRPWYEAQFTPDHPERVRLDEVQRDVAGQAGTTPS